jgi:SAM-dependent methyltransferase
METSSFFLQISQWIDNVVLPYTEKTYQKKWSPHTYSKGLLQLSELFTEGRERNLAKNYFAHPRFRSSYLLYYLPLQLSKMIWILERHHQTIFKSLLQKPLLRILDLGAGPGTMSLGLLMYLQKLKYRGTLELTLVDAQASILKDARQLLESLPFEGQKIIQTLSIPALKALKTRQADLLCVGHMLNEGPTTVTDRFWSSQPELIRIHIEPAFRTASRQLISLRAQLIEAGLPIHGPCPHEGLCPLSRGKDWCHFSEPLDLSSQVFRALSKKLGSTRDWMKFTYLVAGGLKESLQAPFGLVISDNLNPKKGLRSYLTCTPGRATKIQSQEALRRGQMLKENGSTPPVGRAKKVMRKA